MASIKKAFKQIFITIFIRKLAGSTLPESPLQAMLSPVGCQHPLCKGEAEMHQGVKGQQWVSALGACWQRSRAEEGRGDFRGRVPIGSLAVVSCC